MSSEAAFDLFTWLPALEMDVRRGLAAIPARFRLSSRWFGRGRRAGNQQVVQRASEEEGNGVGIHASGNSPGMLLSDQVAAEDTNQPGWTDTGLVCCPSDRSEELIVAVKLPCEREAAGESRIASAKWVRLSPTVPRPAVATSLHRPPARC